jgi:hypothetical protein
LPAAAASLTPVDADGDGNIDLVFVVCGGSGGRCAVVVLFNSLPAVCGGSDDDCRRVCSVDAFDDGSFTPPPVPLPPGDVVTVHYSVKWLPASAAAGGSGSAWSTFAPPTVRHQEFLRNSVVLEGVPLKNVCHFLLQVRCADVYLDGRVLFLIR